MIDLFKLADPFPPDDIEWRVQASGNKDGKIWARVLAYVTNRAIMHRLDESVGPAGWRNEYAAAPCGGVMCGLSVKVEGEWVTKWDGAENTDIEGVKGGLSGAMKRAAVQWGIGRYLYDLDAGYALVHSNGKHSDKLKDGTWFNWDPPRLPTWAIPAPPKSKPEAPKPPDIGLPESAPEEDRSRDAQLSEEHTRLRGILQELAAPDIMAEMDKDILAACKRAQQMAKRVNAPAADLRAKIEEMAIIRARLFFPDDEVAREMSIADALKPQMAGAA